MLKKYQHLTIININVMRERISRFIKYMEFKGLNDNQVTTACHLSRGLIGQARTGKSDLGERAVEKILKEYQDLSRVWLLTGEGKMLVEDNVSNAEIVSKVYGVGDGDREVSKVPVLPIDALASFIEIEADIPVEDLDYEAVVLTPEEKRISSSLCIINVKGDSMSPTVNSGSKVLASRVSKNQWGNVGGIVAVSYADTELGTPEPFFVIKRVASNKLFINNLLKLESDNEEYGEMTVQLADIHAMWECLRIISQPLR